MSANASTPTWSGPETCPFCGEALADPGAGFIAHIERTPDCKDAFEGWRERIRGDIWGEWSG